MKNRKRLVVPAALMVSAGSGCSAGKPACGSEPFHACWPDGGFACPAECGALKLPDGGLELDPMGKPTCLC